MTDAKHHHQLSDLDLFTPNFLHPTLPPLKTGVYKCMGADATMISTPDVLARKAHIHSLIEKAGDEITEALLKQRFQSHKKLMGDLTFKCYKGKFYKGRFFPVSERDYRKERREMAVAGLQRVWAEMGVNPDVGMEKLAVMEEGTSRRRHPDDYW